MPHGRRATRGSPRHAASTSTKRPGRRIPGTGTSAASSSRPEPGGAWAVPRSPRSPIRVSPDFPSRRPPTSSSIAPGSSGGRTAARGGAGAAWARSARLDVAYYAVPCLLCSRMPSVALLGASGYAGQETLDRVLGHPDLHVVALGSDSLAGESASALDVRLNGSLPRFVSNDEPAAAGAELILLCLDHDRAAAFRAPAD